MVPDAQGNQVPLILPVYRSTSTDLTPLIIAGTLLAGGYFLGQVQRQVRQVLVLLQGLLRREQGLLRALERLLWERQVYLPFIPLRLRLSGSLR
jgi:hypothetical protein